MNTIDIIKNQAFQKIIPVHPGKNLLETLHNGMRWDFPPYTMDDINRWNVNLDSYSCFGKVVDAAVIAARFFPETPFAFAEVIEDRLRAMLMEDVHAKGNDESYLREILTYEENHAIPVVDGVPYEPLSRFFPQMIIHPKVNILTTVWEMVAATVLVSKSLLSSDLVEKKKLLDEAKEISPNQLLVDEQIAAFSINFDVDMAVERLEALLERRKTARLLFTLHTLTGINSFRKEMDATYTENMFPILQKELIDNLR